MSNERRIYKNYYLTDRKYVDISAAVAKENVGRLSVTDKIACWPKRTYDGDAALEILPEEKGRSFSVSIPLSGCDFSDKEVLSVAVNGSTPCDMIRIEIIGANGEKSTDEINFFNDRWSRLLVSVKDNPAVCHAEKMDIGFYSVKGIPVENESAYIGEIYFGNTVDLQFERGDFKRYFTTDEQLENGENYLDYTFHKGGSLVFPQFPKARYSVLNAVIATKDSIKITAENPGECEEFRLYVLTDRQKTFDRKRSVSFKIGKGGLKTVIVNIEGLAKKEGERLAGLKLEPVSGCGELRIYDVAPIQEKDIVGDELGKAWMKKRPVKIRNPYAFTVKGRTYYVKDFGAKGDFYSDDTEAVQKTIDTAEKAGGGKVVLENGRFVATHIVMKSGVELHIAETAMLVQSEKPAHYRYPVAYEHDNFYYSIQWAHNFLVHNKPLIYGNKIENFKVTGKGRIRMADTGSEALCGGWPYYDIHCNALIHVIPMMFNKCSCFEVSGITVTRANSYHLFTAHCENVFINDVKFIDPRCLSADGIGVNGSMNYLIANVLMVTNDDGITLNPGYIDPRGYDGNYWDCTPGQDNSVRNFEICHSYINSAYGGWGKAIAFIPWGKSAENQEYEMTEDIYVHDCILKGGHAVGTWCDDPYHGKQPFDGTETDDYSPVSDIVLKKNLYLSKCDLLTVKVTGMDSDTDELKSSAEVVNGDFHDRLCNWHRSEGVAKNPGEDGVCLNGGQEIEQILSSVVGDNSFSFDVCGNGEVFIDGKTEKFSVGEKNAITISKTYRTVKNIRIGIKAENKTIVYGVKRV